MSDYNKKVHEEMTEKIIKAIETGTAPWQRPWDGRCGPHNAGSGRAYTGINSVVLCMKGVEMDGGHDPRWLTYKQAQKEGWQVKKGSKGTYVQLWKPLYKDDGQGNLEIKAVWEKIFTVFHASQVEGIGEYVPPVWNQNELQEKAEEIIKSSKAVIEYCGNQPCYIPALDKIQMPERGYFYTAEGYYSTLLHELIHWTKHKTRLNRDLPRPQEELVAEMGSMFLSAATGIPQSEELFKNHASYIESWRTHTKDKVNAVLSAAANANRAVNYLLGRKEEEEVL